MIRRALMLVGCWAGMAAVSTAQLPAARPSSGAAARPASSAGMPAMTCSGKVVDANDRPLAGATVRLYQPDYGADGSKILSEMTTKEDGLFSFEWPSVSERSNVDLVAQKEGLAIGFADVYSDPFRRTGILIRLAKPSSISGLVVNEAGAPIKGATVEAYLQVVDARGYRYLHDTRWTSVKTDAKGAFKIDNVPPNGHANLQVWAPGRATVNEAGEGDFFAYPAGKDDIRIVLPPEATVSGTVVDAATSRPVAGVKLRVSGGRRGVAAVTGSDGRFSFTGLGAGRIGVGLAPASPVTYEMDWLADSVVVTAEAGKAAPDVIIAISKGGVIDVSVTDVQTAMPIAHAYVSIAATGPAPRPAGAFGGAAGQDGIAHIRVKPGTYQVMSARATGFLGLAPPGRPPQTVDVAEGQTARLAVQLQSLPTIRGVVKDKDGKPVAGAAVWVRFGTPVATGPDGAFELKVGQFGPGQEAPNEVFARHAERGLAGVIEVPQGHRPIELELGGAATVLGKITDAQGKPIANAEVRLTRWVGRFGYSFGQGPPPRSDLDGRYEIKAIPAGSYYISATADGFGEKQEKFSVADGRAETIEKSFALPEARLSISGIVVDMDDKPMAGANVSVYGQGQPQRQAKSDASGKFIVEGVVSTSVELQANADLEGKRRYGLGVRAKGGDRDVKIVLDREADETGRIRRISASATRLTGKPLPELEEFGLKSARQLAVGKRLLVCFWDMEQRPSRRAILSLVEKAADLEAKGVVVIGVQASPVDAKQLRDWAADNKVAFATGMVPAEKSKAVKNLAAWGVSGLPWLILTDEKHVVTSEGLPVERLLQEPGPAASAPLATQPSAAE